MIVEIPDTLVQCLHSANSIVAFTGAGVSAESGVPTFRGTDGIWSKFKPEELATMNAFLKNPALVWEWYNHRRTIIAGITPNPGHYALASMQHLVPRFDVVTQNIDNLHKRAGSRSVFELHGNIERSFCLKCGRSWTNDFAVDSGETPRCPDCGGMVRPDVVWFGEMLPEDIWEASVKASAKADLFLSIGTSGVVYPAASLPLMAKKEGAFVVEVNPEATPLTGVADVFLQGQAGTMLPLIAEALARVRNCGDTSRAASKESL
jgi:NAD-dependent deacetylase